MKTLSAIEGETGAVSQRVWRTATHSHQLSFPRMSLAKFQRTAM